MKKLKALWAEFKAFITRGNVVDMAVAVIIGAAFGAIVTAMTNGIIKPLVDWAMYGVNDGAAGLITMLKPVYTEAVDADGMLVVDMTKSIYIDWGTLIMKIIDFLVIAVVLFVIIKVFMSLKNAGVNAHEKAKAKLVKKLTKKGMSEEEALAQAETETAAAEAAAPAAPSTEELLTQIRDLLAAQNSSSDGGDAANKE